MRLLVIIGLLMMSSPAWADQDSGTIRICRNAAIIGARDRVAVTVKRGSAFTQDIPGSDKIGVIVKVTSDVTIGPKPACATAPAVVTLRPGYAPALSDKSVLLVQFETVGYDLRTRVAGGFR
jgi:hypothetical protein